MATIDILQGLLASSLSVSETAAKLVSYKRAGLPEGEWVEWLRLMDYDVVESVAAHLTESEGVSLWPFTVACWGTAQRP